MAREAQVIVAAEIDRTASIDADTRPFTRGIGRRQQDPLLFLGARAIKLGKCAPWLLARRAS